MDPQITWEEMLDAIAEANFGEAMLKAQDLLGWLNRGGFPPQTLTRLLSNEWDRAVCCFVCEQVIMKSTNEESEL